MIGRPEQPTATDETTWLAAEVISRLVAAGSTVAAAESLTGGLVCAVLTRVPGASGALRGGIVAYATELKATLLGVDADLLATRGPVDTEVARAMAIGVRDRLGATFGVATTGVAGPDEQDGHPVGTVHVAVIGPGGSVVRSYAFGGDRAAVRRQTVDAALSLLMTELAGDGAAPPTDQPIGAAARAEEPGREASTAAGRWEQAWTSSAAHPTERPGTVDQ